MENKDRNSNPSGRTLIIFDRTDRVTIGKSSVIGSRKEQQDTILTGMDYDYMQDGRIIAVLCDGMGGMQGGAMASQIAASNVYYGFRAMPEGMDIRDFFDDILTHVDQDVHSLRTDTGAPMHAGTTIVSAAITDGLLYLANVGDSHGYLIRDGKLNLITKEHNLMMLLLEQVARGEITMEEARRNPKREALVSYLGMGGLRYRQVPDPPLALRDGDYIVLCSDGLYRSVSGNEILDVILSCETDVQSAADQLTELAISKGNKNQDNTSVVVLMYKVID